MNYEQSVQNGIERGMEKVAGSLLTKFRKKGIKKSKDEIAKALLKERKWLRESAFSANPRGDNRIAFNEALKGLRA